MPKQYGNPYNPWQRGTNENTNGLLRQYFPKRTDFTKMTLEEIKLAQHRLNNRPRKVLGWNTPLKEFKKTAWCVQNLNSATVYVMLHNLLTTGKL